MTWAAKVSATQLTSIVDTFQYFDQTPTLGPGETAHVEIELDPVSTPTDDLVVEVFGTLDDTSENWDDTAITGFTIDKDTDPNKVSFSISGIYKFRVGVKAAGSTDSHTSADMSFRLDTIHF